MHGVGIRLVLHSLEGGSFCIHRVKCFYAGVRWAISLPKEAVLTRQALASALTSALGQVRPSALSGCLPMRSHIKALHCTSVSPQLQMLQRQQLGPFTARSRT